MASKNCLTSVVFPTCLALSDVKSEDIDALFENNELDDMGYNSKVSRYRIRISEEDLKTKREALKELFLPVKKKYEEE